MPAGLNAHTQKVLVPYGVTLLTGGIFETGAYGVSSKSQNSTILGQSGPSSTQFSNPSWPCHWHLAPTTTLSQSAILTPSLV